MTDDLARDEAAERRRRRVESILGERDDPPPEPAAEGGRRLGGYRLLRRLGAGGMGVVWLARDDALGRHVAVKELAPRLVVDAEAIRRFGLEAAATARLDHPGIVTVYGAGEDEEGHRFLAMEYVEGVGLDRVLAALQGRRARDLTDAEVQAVVHALLAAGPGAAARPAPWEPAAPAYSDRVADWGRQLAEALAHAHERGVLHRDVKPSNVLVDAAGRVRIVDFGLARIDEASALTRTGTILGTLTYMAPEALRGGAEGVDARADVYALGATLHELLALRPLYEAHSITSLVAAIQGGRVPRLDQGGLGVPRDLAAVVHKCLEPDRTDRYGTARDLAEDLARVLRHEPVRARPPGALRRLRTWARRRPGAAAACAAGLLAAAAALPVAQAVQRERDRTRIEQLRDEAEAAWRRYEVQDALLAAARERWVEAKSAPAYPRNPDRIRRQRRAEREIETAKFARGVALAAADGAYATAAVLSAPHGWDTEEFSAGRAKVIAARSDDARRRGDRIAEAIAIEELTGFDPDGRLRDALGGPGTLVVSLEPPDAEAYLFRYETLEEDARGEPLVPRMVPVPWRGEAAAAFPGGSDVARPGDECLVLTEVEPGSFAEAHRLRAGDLVLRIRGESAGPGCFVSSIQPGGVADREHWTPWLRLAAVDQVPVEGLYELTHAKGGDSVWVTADPGREATVPRGKRLDEALGVTLVAPEELLRLPAPDGGVVVRVLRSGIVEDLRLPGGTRLGVVCETTAYPLLVHEGCRVRAGDELRLSAGSFLVLARREGFEDLRLPVVVESNATAICEGKLLATGSTPRGYVWIPPGTSRVGGDPELVRGYDQVDMPVSKEVKGFFLSRRELTVREWFGWINRPETLAWIERERAAGRTVALPRHYDRDRPFARLGEDGRWVPDLPLDAAILGITRRDAEAFMASWNDDVRARGDRWLLRLPTVEEWQRAARGADERMYPWGDRYDPSLCVALDSRPGRLMEAETHFAVYDESPFGIFDMAGSRRELGEGLVVHGGSWADSGAKTFRVCARDSLGPGWFNWSLGVRFALERNPDAK